MKTLILDGSQENDPIAEELNSLLKNVFDEIDTEITHIPLAEKRVVSCQGCFDCWLRTPGICRINDFGREIAKQMVVSDLIIFLTPIIFGGYSYELKKAIDRFIPNLLPFFKKVEGEIHHKQRYENLASKIFIGYLDKPDNEKETIFKELTQRNSLNMEGDIFESLIYIKNRNLPEFTTKLQNKIQEVQIQS